MKGRQILMQIRSMKFTAPKSFCLALTVLSVLTITVPNVLCLDPEKDEQEINIILNPEQPVHYYVDPKKNEKETEIILSGAPPVHNLKSPYDLHNLCGSMLGIMELEVLRIGDYLIDLPHQGPELRPLNRTADWIQRMFREIPQVKPVSRFGQLVDALQIRQLNLSDLRTAPSIAAGNFFKPSPNMQVRIYKLLRLTQDLLNDSDGAVLFPVNKIASAVNHKPVRVKALGWLGDGLGQARKGMFKFCKIVNKAVVKGASYGIYGVEKGVSEVRGRDVNRKTREWIVYFKMPASFYENERQFFDQKAPEIYVGSLEEWRKQLVAGNGSVEKLLVHAKRGWRPYSDIPSADEVLVATRLRYLKKAPDVVRDYIIDADEFDALVFEKSSPRTHLKIMPAASM